MVREGLFKEVFVLRPKKIAMQIYGKLKHRLSKQTAKTQIKDPSNLRCSRRGENKKKKIRDNQGQIMWVFVGQ